MGLFSSSKSSSAMTTNVITTTTTNIRDIGITGNQGIELEKIMQQGTTDRALIAAQPMDRMLTQVGGIYEKLVGGAGDYANELVDTADRKATEILAAAAPESTLMQKALPYAAAALLGVLLIMKGGK